MERARCCDVSEAIAAAPSQMARATEHQRRRERQDDGVPVPPPIAPRPNLLPLADPGLTWGEFETFCRAYVSARSEVRRVEAYAKHGEPQDGIDLVAFLHDGKTRTYQCRKRAKFSATDAADVVRTTTYSADEHEILISCEANKAVRKYVHPLPGWDLSDCKDLSLAVRELDRSKAWNVVEDAFGVPWRRAFLGPQESLVFVDSERYFRPFERVDALLRHTWQLVGRAEILDALIGAVDQADVRAVVLVGRGGIGKTRLLRALSERLDQPERRILFALDDAEITAAAVEMPPLDDAVVVVDDMHRRNDLAFPLLVETARRQPGELTIVLATRPQRVDELRGSLARAGLQPDQVVVLPSLGDLAPADGKALAAEALGDRHTSWIEPLGRATADCPLVTVIGGQLLAQRKVQPGLFEREADFRDAVLERWRDEMLGRVSRDVDERAAATTLRLLAALAPLNVDDVPTLERMADEAELSIPELRSVLGELREADLLVAHGRLRRIVPDVLADHVLHGACLDRQGEPNGYAEALFERYRSCALPALLRNLAELDWRVGATAGASRLLDEVWARIRASFLDRDASGRVELLDQLQPAAHLQPEQVLELARLALERPAPPSPLDVAFDSDFGDGWVREHLPELVRRAGAGDEHVEQALAVLWSLGREDQRPPSIMGLTPPVRAMQELGDYRADGHASNVLVAFVEGLVAGPEADAPVSPLILLERSIAREGTSLQPAGLGFMPLHYNLRADPLEDVRRRVFAVLALQARHGTQRNRAFAAHLLGEALAQPRGAFGQPNTPETFDQWLPEQLHLLDLIAELMSGTAPLVRSRLRTAVAWHADHSAWPQAQASSSRVLRSREEDDEQVMTCIAQPFDFHRDEDDDRRRLNAVAERLAAADGDIAQQMDELLAELQSVGAEANPHPLLATLIERAPGCGEKLVDAALRDPERPLAHHLDILLSALHRASPGLVAPRLRRLDPESLPTRRALASSLGGLDWTQGSREHELAMLQKLVKDDDLQVRHTAMRAVLFARSAHRDRTTELALSADLGRSGALAGLMCQALGDSDRALDPDQLERALDKLRDIDTLEYGTVEFLAQVGEHDPSAVLAVLIDRLARSRGRTRYEPVPWHPFRREVLAGADDDAYLDLLRRVREEALASDAMVRHEVPRLFWHLDRDTDLSLQVLHEWLTCGDVAKVAAAAHLLSGIAPGRRSHQRDELDGWQELLARPWFVIDVLEQTASKSIAIRDAARAGLADVLFSDDVHRTLGEPGKRSLCSHESATRLLSWLPVQVAARSFFTELAERSKRVLERERIDDEEYPHRLR